MQCFQKKLSKPTDYLNINSKINYFKEIPTQVFFIHLKPIRGVKLHEI